MEFRLGGTGAGLFVGCGAGLGFLTPLQLHSVPVLGQLASGLSQSLGSLDAAVGGLGGGARRHVRGLGIKGLDAGFGCGVMLGYGYGAGLMLTPDALRAAAAAAGRLKEQVLARLPPELKGAIAAQRPAAVGGATGMQPLAPQTPATSLAAASAVDPVPGYTSDALPATAEQQPQPGSQRQQRSAAQQQDLADIMRLVLKQQNLLEDLQQQVGQLQAAVCRLDPSAPGCKSKK